MLGTFIYINSIRGIAAVSTGVHSAYLTEIIYNFKNDLVSGNYRSFRNQMATFIDHKIIAGYRIVQNQSVIEASDESLDEFRERGFREIAVPIWFDDQKTEPWGEVYLFVGDSEEINVDNLLLDKIRFGIIIFVLAIILLSIAYLYFWKRFSLSLAESILQIFAQQNGGDRVSKSILWQPILQKIEDLKVRNDLFLTREYEYKQNKSLMEISKQVAHDIRSPLSALNFAIPNLSELPEDRRLLIKNATQRINDIANNLLVKSRELQVDSSFTSGRGHSSSELNEVLLSSLVDSIISEKRIQNREKIGVKIDVDLKSCYGVFVLANSIELSRVLSNLINNSVEAFGVNGGNVSVSLRGYADLASIVIQDNGHGIPKDILGKLGQNGFSYGKTGLPGSGTGIGLHHAFENIKRWHGKMNIQSEVGRGTIIEIQLPRTNSPTWFLRRIELEPGAVVVSIDDDLTIHQIWKDRLKSISEVHGVIEHISYTSVAEFNLLELKKNMVFFVDYDFVRQNKNGLNLIKAKNIADRSILVTSNYDDAGLKLSCQEIGLKILPKQLAPFVEIIIKREKVMGTNLKNEDARSGVV